MANNDDEPGPLMREMANCKISSDFLEKAMPVAPDPDGDEHFFERNKISLFLYQGWWQAERGMINRDPRFSPEPMCAFQQIQNDEKRRILAITKTEFEKDVEWFHPKHVFDKSSSSFVSLSSCPTSPLCGKNCRWPEKKLLLTMAWRFRDLWKDLPESIFRHLLSFIRDHPRPTVLDLPQGARLRINRGYKIDEFNYFDAPAIVLELWAFATGTLDQFQTIRCGLPRLIDNNPEIFWSALLNFKASKTIAPFKASAFYLKDSPIGEALAQLDADFQRQNMQRQDQNPVFVQTSSAFARLFIENVAGLPPEFADETFDDPIEQCPRWWKSVTKPWDQQFKRLVEDSQFFPCYYQACELGCVAQELGRQCNASHDQNFVDWIHDKLTRPHLCLKCSTYADKLRCSACKRFYCSRACARADRLHHRTQCFQFQRYMKLRKFFIPQSSRFRS